MFIFVRLFLPELMNQFEDNKIVKTVTRLNSVKLSTAVEVITIAPNFHKKAAKFLSELQSPLPGFFKTLLPYYPGILQLSDLRATACQRIIITFVGFSNGS